MEIARNLMVTDPATTGTVRYERMGQIAYLTISRPQKRNAFSRPMETEMIHALARFDFDSEAWVAIIVAEGSDFTVGADINERFDDSREGRDRWMSAGPVIETYLGRTANWKPVIAAVQGWCVGLGFNLALECDLVVATADSKFMVAEAKRGIPAGLLMAKMQCFMPSKIATEMVLIGDPVGSRELYRLGLINRIVDHSGNLMAAAEDLAAKLLAVPPLAVRAHVRISRWQWKRPLDESALYLQGLKLHLTEDFEEATRAFVTKSSPVFRAK
jgi:enoyl-CoA hydratase/carnithine racemase